MKNGKDKLISIYLMCGLILLVIGFSYAFFIYNKTGLYTHTINGGKMKVIYSENAGNNITIENAYPITDEEALTKSLEFEFTITGYNESEKNVYYAIEMDYGEEVADKNRFLDRDMKLTLYENTELVFENEIFNNLDNQDIHYGYINFGTSSENPIINNYLLRIWINDNVIISDTLSDDLSTWSETDANWFFERYESEDELFNELINACPDGTEGCYLSDLGMNVYKSDEFANRYANFKVNIRADLSYDDVGYLTYDANGGTNTPEKTSLLTNTITMQKPVKDGKGFLGWSTDPSAVIPEYFSGDTYTGNGQLLYAVYSNVRNVMAVFPDDLKSQGSNINEIYFISDSQENIDLRYNDALQNTYAIDLTYDNNGSVKGWLELDENGETILYIGSYGATYFSNCVNLFSPFSNCRVIDFGNADSSMIDDMSYMFSMAGAAFNPLPTSFEENNVVVKRINTSLGYLKIQNIDVLDTSNVTTMQGMFKYSGVAELNLKNLDTSQVTNMSEMFSYCNLPELDLSGLNTQNLQNMSGMFYESKVQWLNISSFDTSNVTDMSNLFYDCMQLRYVNLKNFDTSNVTNMSYMFHWCQYFNDLDLSSFNTINVVNMEGMFRRCTNIVSLDLNTFDTSKVEDMSSMFEECMNLKNLDVSSFDTGNVTDMSDMFLGCYKLVDLDVSSFNTENVINMESMFSNGLTTTSNVLTEIKGIENFNTVKVENMSHMFDNRTKITNLDLSKWTNDVVMDMSYMFCGCDDLTNLNINGSFNTKNVTNMSHMFAGCNSLNSINLSNFDTANVDNMSSMFSQCSNLNNVDLSNFDTSNVNRLDYCFYKCTSLTSLDLSSLNFDKVTDIWSTFEGCTNLKTLDISSFTMTSNITNTSFAFRTVGSSLSSGEYTTIYVNSTIEQSWILSLSTSDKPSGWSTANVIIKS